MRNARLPTIRALWWTRLVTLNTLVVGLVDWTGTRGSLYRGLGPRGALYGEDHCIMGGDPHPPNRMTHMTEYITFPQPRGCNGGFCEKEGRSRRRPALSRYFFNYEWSTLSTGNLECVLQSDSERYSETEPNFVRPLLIFGIHFHLYLQHVSSSPCGKSTHLWLTGCVNADYENNF